MNATGTGACAGQSRADARIRNSFRYASRKYWDALSKDLRPIYTAVNADAAATALEALAEEWGARYPAMIRLWRSSWSEFIPFLDYHVEIRKVLCFTNAIESLNARYRRAVKARGHFLLVTWNQLALRSSRPHGPRNWEAGFDGGAGGQVAGSRSARAGGCLAAGVD